jgi:DNA-binding Lrp family transcriptional regulator
MATRSELPKKIEDWAKAKGITGRKRILKELLKQFQTPPKIAQALKVKPGSVVALRELLKAEGLYKTFRLEDRVRELGYGSPREFFVANAMKTYKVMAEQLGCTWMAVQKQYERVFKTELEGAARG